MDVRKVTVPYVSGEDTAKTGDPCAACDEAGDYRLKRTLERHGGVRMMLCIDFRSCNRRSGVVKR